MHRRTVRLLLETCANDFLRLIEFHVTNVEVSKGPIADRIFRLSLDSSFIALLGLIRRFLQQLNRAQQHIGFGIRWICLYRCLENTHRLIELLRAHQRIYHGSHWLHLQAF